MIDRFKGTSGRSALLRVLGRNASVAMNDMVAGKFIDEGELIEVAKGDYVIRQDDSSQDVFFVISGSFSVIVNGQQVAERGIGEHVGEMAAFNPSQPRAASLVAQVNSVVLKVPADCFIEALMECKESLMGTVTVLTERLAARNKDIRPKNLKPRVFVISTVEALPLVRAIEVIYAHDDIEIKPWTEGTFLPSGYPLDDLISAIHSCDFCIAIASPDDETTRRGSSYKTPRDNVIFEAGMSAGALGRERTFILVPQGHPPTLPTDLSGLTTLRYRETDSSGKPNLRPVCHQILEVIKALGVR